MRIRGLLGALLLLLVGSGPAAAQSVDLEFNDGLVTLRAHNAPVRTILAEWARLGGTQMVNGDRVPGVPVTLELDGVPERQALDILLRGAAGYMIASRGTAQGPSSFDRVLILPTSSAPFNPPPPAGFVPPPPPLPDFDDIPNDFDPDLQRFRTPRDFVPADGVPGQTFPPQPYQPDPDGPAQPPPSTRPMQPVMPGAARPGEIIPVPQPQPQIDDDP